MNPVRACPPPSAWHDYIRGVLPPDEAGPLEEHLEACDACAVCVDRTLTDDRLLHAMREQSGQAAVPVDHAVMTTMSRVRDLLTRGATPDPDDTGPVPAAFAYLGPPTTPDDLGRLGPFRVRRVLGEGGMGVVFLAEDVELRRPVALKVLKPFAAANPRGRDRFLREARAAAALSSDHVVTIYHVGQEGDVPYLAMEYMEGETLEERLRRDGQLSAAEATRIGRDIALGLAAVHEAGLVHRDVKPSNVWLDARAGRAKLLDFGLARAGEPAEPFTQEGWVVGTPSFMAPEQARAQTVGPRADLFSLGCVLYRACAGRLPFPGDTPLAQLTALAADTPAPVRQDNPGVPEGLAELIGRLLDKDPARRPTSAQAVADALAVLRLAALGRTDEAAAVPKPRRVSRRRLVAMALGVLVLLGTAAFLAVAAHRGPRPEEGPGAGNDPGPTKRPAPPVGVVTDFAEVHGADLDAFEVWLDQVRKDAFRPTYLSVRTTPGGPLFSAVAVKDGRDLRWRAFARATIAEDAERFQKLKFDHRPTAFCAYPSGGVMLRAALWEEDRAGGWWAKYGLPLEEHRRFVAEGRAKGFRIDWLSAHTNPAGRTVYVGILRPSGSAEWLERYDLTAEELRALLAEHQKRGWRPHLMYSYPLANEPRFLTVLVRDDDRSPWDHQVGLSPAEYEAELVRRRRDGFRPLSVAGYDDGEQTRYAVCWVRFSPTAGP